jgi:ParB-like chromosome segregation protein Spo0J
MGAFIVPVDDIIGRENRVTHDYVVGLYDSIACDGIMHPPILSRDLEVINGVNRVCAARTFGWEHIAAYVCDVSLHDARDLN